MFMRKLTREELAQYTGKDGAPAYVAYQGKVYDATDSWQWRNGRHQARHLAGADLAGGFEGAPHGPELLQRLPVVGVLADEE
jgi:predicted heme/steroid binding protein